MTLCIAGGELFAYQTATLTGPNAYNLTFLERGLNGSAASAHPTGTPFARLDGAIFEFPLPAAFVGVEIFLKLQSFNVFGHATQDLSTCQVFSFTPLGSGTLGPVAQALLVGSNLDYGLASAGVTQSDDFGLASDPFTTLIDLGLASS